MTYVQPANRNNGHTKRYKAELYPMPKSDKTGYLTRLTVAANDVLAKVSYKYAVGMRVRGKTSAIRYGGQWVTGIIRMVSHNIGLNEYVIKDDAGTIYIIDESNIQEVLSIEAVTSKAIVIYEKAA